MKGRACKALIFLGALAGISGAVECKVDCSNEFVNNCISGNNNQGYCACRSQLDADPIVSPLKNHQCVSGCDDTTAMAAIAETCSGPGPSPSPSPGSSPQQPNCPALQSGVFTANAEGEGPLLPCICTDSTRSGCEVKFDVPAGCAGDAGKQCPLVFFFHGAGGTNVGWSRTASPELHAVNKFIGIYPNGVDNGWNTGSTDIPGTKVDDCGFVQEIMNMLHHRYGWDARAYGFGRSNGAAMCQRLAVNGPLGFAGIAPSATQLLSKPNQGGPGPFNFNIPSVAAGTNPIAYMSFHATNDGAIPYEGGRAPPGGDSNLITLDTVVNTNALWAANNGCATTKQATTVNAVIGGQAQTASTAEHQVFDSCPATSPVEHYKVVDGEHSTANSIEVSNQATSLERIALDFFARIELACDSAAANTCAHPSFTNSSGPSPTPSPTPSPAPSSNPSPTPSPAPSSNPSPTPSPAPETSPSTPLAFSALTALLALF